jgi:glutamine synthetase
MIAAGLHGVENQLDVPPAYSGNAYSAEFEHVPTTLHEAADLLQGSKLARLALGDAVVEHYVNAARVEIAAYDAAVTDWERTRGFERM